MQPGDSPQLRKQRGAFFTPYEIAQHLADWALRGSGNECIILDPTCGDGAFLRAAADLLAARQRTGRLIGTDIHQPSLDHTAALLGDAHGCAVDLLRGDFFEEPTPDQLTARLPYVDAVIGNPPYVRYHEHRGDVRRRAAAAALAQGVRLSGLASSWAALLVHASAFLKPDGRITMVLPAELLSVGYAEPVRRWLRRRFRSVHLVLFEELQFADAEEQVVLLVARGSGGCNAFTLHHVRGAEELRELHIYDADAFAPQPTGKWTELLVQEEARGLLRQMLDQHFMPLKDTATAELGTVTGANNFFMLSERTRREYKLVEGRDVLRSVPPGSRHLKGLEFTTGQWEQLRLKGERVWMLNPTANRPGTGLRRYLALGEQLEVDRAYKCTVRTPWWRPPVVRPPDYFFTYMSHVSPRLIRNDARVTFVNSMHGVRLRQPDAAGLTGSQPILALNTVTRLGAEIFGRAYGGGILKMEPTEAGQLPLPRGNLAEPAWGELADRRAHINELIARGHWSDATTVVDEVLLQRVAGLSTRELEILRAALVALRRRRHRRSGNGE
ncbi:MAG TPA: N-6 DNA methylase [Pseudonocardiaceae bacterium]|nr:N-6 DNA methylase [Pseudonocardiaceae bacterium]